jgi:hypothetical protein
MKRINYYLHLSSLLLISLWFSNCSKQDQCKELSPCKRETVKEIENLVGEVHHDSSRDEFYIIFTEQGTYDTQYIAYPCSLDNEFQHAGIMVSVTGAFKEMCEEIQPAVGGQTYYYLKISDISRNQPQTDK